MGRRLISLFLTIAISLSQLNANSSTSSTENIIRSVYLFSDFTPKGAFETSRDQLQIAVTAFHKKGAQAFVDRFQFFNQADQETLLKTLGKVTDELPITFESDKVIFDNHVFTYEEKNFLIDKNVFEYDEKISLEANSQKAAALMSAKVSWIENFIQRINPLPVAEAKGGGLAAAGAVIAALLGGLYLLNSNSIQGVGENGTQGHKSLRARFSGLGNYLRTAFNGPTQNALQEALASAQANAGKFTNKRYMILVDYANCRNQNSFFVIDLTTNKAVRSYRIPPAYGSTDRSRMCTTSCSDTNGSGKNEAGAMVTTGNWGQGSHTGEGILLKGLESRNANTSAREIKIHEGTYKDSGNSAGCFVLSRPEIEDLKAFVTPGTFVYAANCPRAS